MTNKPQELLPCPFCGNGATISHWSNGGKYTMVNCIVCGCNTGKRLRSFDAVARWNTRALPAPVAGDVVERVARAIYDDEPARWYSETPPHNGQYTWSELTELDKHKWCKKARAAIAALPACGISQSENRCKDVCEANSPRPSVVGEDEAVEIIRRAILGKASCVNPESYRCQSIAIYRALVVAGVINEGRSK